MSATATRKPPTPRTLQKRKLTLAEAADQWEKAKRETARQKALLDEAAPVLLSHFEKTGRSTYKDRIAREPTGGSLVLDQPKVREFLGKRLVDFQKLTERGWSLKLLK